MNTTIFLAQFWGPIVLAIGLGIFFSRRYYTKMYRDLEKNSLAVLGLGIAFMVVGIIQVSVHNVWNNFPQFLISLFGWGALIKGIVFLIAPRWVDKAGDAEAKSGWIPTLGVVMIILGAYLSYLAYLA